MKEYVLLVVFTLFSILFGGVFYSAKKNLVNTNKERILLTQRIDQLVAERDFYKNQCLEMKEKLKSALHNG